MNPYGYPVIGGVMTSGYVSPYLVNNGVGGNSVTQVGDTQFDMMMRNQGMNIGGSGGSGMSNQGYGQGYNNQSMMTQGNNGNGSYLSSLQGRVVSCKEEVIASMIPMDGNDYYFIDKSNGKIYTKTFTMDGRSVIRTYNLEKPEDAQVQQSSKSEKVAEFDESKFVTREDYNALSKTVEELRSNLQQLVMTLAQSGSQGQPMQNQGFVNPSYPIGVGNFVDNSVETPADNKNKKR